MNAAGNPGLPSVQLRAVTLDDCALLLRWQTAQARRYFHRPEVPSAAEHRRWFDGRLAMTEPMLWIVERASEAVGYVRLDVADDRAEGMTISVLVHEPYQGRGLAAAALLELRRMMPKQRLRAEIHPQNIASQKAFEKAGYARVADNLMISDPAMPNREQS